MQSEKDAVSTIVLIILSHFNKKTNKRVGLMAFSKDYYNHSLKIPHAITRLLDGIRVFYELGIYSIGFENTHILLLLKKIMWWRIFR